jgi:hypothetical protein
MRRFSRRVWLLLIIGALFIIGTIAIQLATPAGNDASLPRGTTLSAAPKGALALSQWLGAEGYDVERVREFPFSGNSIAALFVIVPTEKEFSDDEAKDVVSFVERGGTLILATEGSTGTQALDRALEISVHHGTTGSGETATPLGPTLGRPPVRRIAFKGDATVDSDIPGDVRFLPRAASANGTVVATMTRGAGRVHLLSGPYPLTNEGLTREDNLALVQNLLAGLPAGATIGFDEFHHGYGLGSSIADRALRSPWGWALFYLAALTFVALALNGRRFGRPLPSAPVPPQAPAEYARALGNRWQERKEYAFAQAHIAERLKQGFAVAFGIDPALDDVAFGAALHARRPDLASEYATLLTDLRTGAKNDAALVSQMQRTDDLLRRASEAQPVISSAA